MADSVKDILRGFESFPINSSKGGDIDSRGHSTGGSQVVQKLNNVDGQSIGGQNAKTLPSQSSQKGQKERCTTAIAKERGDRVRQLREKQQVERQQKLQELKDQAAATQKFREQQELTRRQRMDDMRQRDSDRRNQVEERRRLIECADQDRKEASLRRKCDRDSRIELKRKQERSNVVFAFGSSTPRMLDPKESSYGYWGSRKATSSSNVNVPDASIAIRRPDLAESADLSRKRATSAHSLNRKPDGDDIMSQSMTATTPTAARRRTDLFPVLPTVRNATSAKSRHRSSGMQSGSTTPNSSSRPASALSQGSSGQQVTLRSKTTARKPRPLSIAGSSLSSADKPRSNASVCSLTSRESRPIDRKSSVGSALSGKLTRAKSAGGSDSNVTSTTKATTARAAPTPKRTLAQVKAESAARKAAEKSKITQKKTPQVTPLASPAVPTKPLPCQADETEPSVENVEKPDAIVIAAETVIEQVFNPETVVQLIETNEPDHLSETNLVEKPDVPNDIAEKDQKIEKPVTGYTNEDEYKAALAENRRLAREAKEKELEMEKQRELEAAEKEKRDEEEYLRLVEEQRKAEEERLKKAIEEAEQQRELDTKRKEEEEIQRLEAEKIEKQKQAEAAERMRQEEIERQARKSRVAAIMSRTRGRGASKSDGKSPDELRVGDNLTMSDSFMANISSSMSDSMIVEAIQSRQNEEEEEMIIDEAVETTENVPVMAEPELKEMSPHLNGGTIDSSKFEVSNSVNGDVHNGAVMNGKADQTAENQFDSFDPFSPSNHTTTNDTHNFDQIIDLSQSKLTNEDVVNSNPPAPIIAFEENINKKQSQDSSSTNVPDLLL